MSVIAHFKTLLKSNDLFKRQFIVKNKVLLGTHHKTGTFWFGKIFSDIASKLGLEFVASTHEQNVPNGTWDIYQNSHSRFDKPALGEFKGVHVVRDPRDQIISATFYHQTSDEEWLHVPRDEFGGSTYQEKINSFSSFDDRMLFEMEGSAYGNIMAMIEFDHSDERFVTAKFEELITDQRLEKFEDIFEFLGFRGIAMGWCLISAYRNSLFSNPKKSAHIRSGKPKQWPKHFKPIHRQRFEELFGDAIKKIGYEEEWELLD